MARPLLWVSFLAVLFLGTENCEEKRQLSTAQEQGTATGRGHAPGWFSHMYGLKLRVLGLLVSFLAVAAHSGSCCWVYGAPWRSRLANEIHSYGHYHQGLESIATQSCVLPGCPFAKPWDEGAVAAIHIGFNEKYTK